MDAATDVMFPPDGRYNGGEAAAGEGDACGSPGHAGVGDVYGVVDAGSSEGGGAADVAVGYGHDGFPSPLGSDNVDSTCWGYVGANLAPPNTPP